MLDLPFSFRLALYFRSSCTHDTISWVVFFSVFRIRTYKNSVLEIWKLLSFHFLLVKFVKNMLVDLRLVILGRDNLIVHYLW